jgi:hypothetical protein
MSIHLERKDLINVQQMEVEVNGPDGANHLIICTGMASLDPLCHETYTFLVGPQISRRQFVGAVASGALSTVQGCKKDSVGDGTDIELEAGLVFINADYDDESGHVKVTANVSSSTGITKVAISYNVSLLAELSGF